ncbi:hypothetical protein BE17_12715 [Sorangium cellulosum]|uniref:Uncharacterized protein n=1 Tax=Sorangium cellulosum TaxID=56 RepID=A0A150RY21_SORCE|nr:hypothetical protein BE17_12715 [Sorangium cellulosum]
MTDDAAVPSTATDAAAGGGPLGPRWATSEPPSTVKPPEDPATPTREKELDALLGETPAHVGDAE